MIFGGSFTFIYIFLYIFNAKSRIKNTTLKQKKYLSYDFYIRGGNMGKTQALSEEQARIFGKNFTALVDYAKKKNGHTAAKIYDQIYGDGNPYGNDKITKLKQGKTVTFQDVMKIQAWKDLSLDWLLLGKGDPPPELQEDLGEGKSTDSEAEPDTVHGFLLSLMYLSTCRYIYDFRVFIRTDHFVSHQVKIFFSIPSFHDPAPEYDQCDTVSYLTYGLQNLSVLNRTLFRLTNRDITNVQAKMTKYLEILETIPSGQRLSDYKKEMEWRIEEDYANCFDPITGINITIPKESF